MAFCSNCGKELNSSARFCDGCGTPVSGAENKRNTVYEGNVHKCPHCGYMNFVERSFLYNDLEGSFMVQYAVDKDTIYEYILLNTACRGFA